MVVARRNLIKKKKAIPRLYWNLNPLPQSVYQASALTIILTLQARRNGVKVCTQQSTGIVH